MVDCIIVNSYHTTAYAMEDSDTEQGSGDHHEPQSFTRLRKCSRYEPDSNEVGKLGALVEDIKKGKEKREDIWCTQCHIDLHTKDNFPDFQNYLLSRESNTLSFGRVPWCHIFQVYGHRHEECGYM